MRVTTSKSKNAESFYISKGYVNDKGVSTSVIIRKLGTLKDLLPEHGPTRDDVMVWAKEQARIETLKYKQEKEEKQIKITAIPSILDNERAKAMIETLTGRLAEGTGDIESTKDSFFEEALYQGSCKAAIKAGQYDTDENIEWVVRTLKSIHEIICCPHGRPVAIELSKHEIEHLFKRI